jgi:hypothetical protein
MLFEKKLLIILTFCILPILTFDLFASKDMDVTCPAANEISVQDGGITLTWHYFGKSFHGIPETDPYFSKEFYTKNAGKVAGEADEVKVINPTVQGIPATTFVCIYPSDVEANPTILPEFIRPYVTGKHGFTGYSLTSDLYPKLHCDERQPSSFHCTYE